MKATSPPGEYIISVSAPVQTWSTVAQEVKRPNHFEPLTPLGGSSLNSVERAISALLL